MAHRGQGGRQLVGDKQALLANEKQRRRGESHNAVERRRRDNINEKTNELATLIPQCMLDVGGEFFLFFLGWWLVPLSPFGAFGVNHGVGGFLPFPFPLRGIPSIPIS